jgi:flagellar basal-body rod protein FlgB
MDLNKLPLFAMATKRMGWLAKRQEVLSQNVANADTPSFVPHDLKAQDFRAMVKAAGGGSRGVQPVALARTEPGHLAPRIDPGRVRDQKDREDYEIAPSGNAVILEEQLMKVSETQTDYRMATSLYHKHLNMIKEALGRRGG